MQCLSIERRPGHTHVGEAQSFRTNVIALLRDSCAYASRQAQRTGHERYLALVSLNRPLR